MPHHVAHASECVHVVCHRPAFVLQAFGGCPAEGARLFRGRCHVEIRGIIHHGQSKVSDENVAIEVDEDIELPHSEKLFLPPLMT
jgi:hypothetical protein